MFRKFVSDRRGNFALITALALMPLVLSVGFAIDGSRYYKARSHLQGALDTAALAVAASPEQDTAKLRELTEQFILSNLDPKTIESVELDWFSSSTEEIDVGVRGSIRTTFMRLANYETMPLNVATLAKRAPEQVVEVAMVLDNTYSMIAADPKTGETRIATLRKAAKSLVETLLPQGEKDGNISIALVPYADHVNVGTGNKTASWIALNRAEETVVTGNGDKVCTAKVKTGTEQYCKTYAKTTCSRTKDGIVELYSCDNKDICLTTATRDTYSTPTCTGSDRVTTEYKFYGCVGTRVTGNLRLSDSSPTSKYPGYVETTQKCARPIIPLTKIRSDLLAGVAGMTHQTSTSYSPNTHIPSGLVWGLNVLSPLEPIEGAQPYDDSNKWPRKIMILMTDGDNTLIYNKTTGKHADFAAKAAEADFKNVNKDSADICNNIKAKKIEIYSIAFGVTKQEAKDLLKGCATSPAYYYDATDAAQLTSAFSGIARAISQVRLAR